jgi:hypothetical protein
MKYGVTLIPYGNLTAVLPELIPFLHKSELVSNGRSSIDDIVRYLYTGQMALWAAYEEDTKNIIMFMVTEIKQYPQKKMLVWQYAAGEELIADKLKNIAIPLMEKFARDMGCDGIECVGRHGWKPTAKEFGYSSYAVTYEKFFE